MTPSPRITETAVIDPLPLFTGLAGLRWLAGMYPAAHPAITHRLVDLQQIIRRLMSRDPDIRLDIIHGHVHLNGAPLHDDGPAYQQIVNEFIDLGIESIHIRAGVECEELRAVAEVLWQLRDGYPEEPLKVRLTRLNVRHISLGRIVSLDTRWNAQHWPDVPTGPLDPAYAEALARAEMTFDAVTRGQAVNAVTVRDLVKLLMYEVARSQVALAQVLALKAYENLTYCHSVNVAVLSLMLGTQIALDEPMLSALVEAALLHDVGKTKVPLAIVRKPGPLDPVERKLIESHTLRGAEILIDTDGLQPLTATVALEHHRSLTGGGYPDLGAGVPHAMSQIVSVADVYEALTGARSYQDPRSPAQACLVLARKAGETLNTSLVKAFVAAVTFFPVGSLVRTSQGETAVVVRTHADDPLHPALALVDGAGARTAAGTVEIDTRARDEAGEYERHVVTTLPIPHGFDVAAYLAPGTTLRTGKGNGDGRRDVR